MPAYAGIFLLTAKSAKTLIVLCHLDRKKRTSDDTILLRKFLPAVEMTAINKHFAAFAPLR